MSTLLDQSVHGSISETMENYGQAYPGSRTTSGKCLGGLRYRAPEPSGSFTPNILRVNPVKMYRTLGTCAPADLEARVVGSGTWEIPQYKWITTGHLAGECYTPIAFPYDPNLVNWAIQEAAANMQSPLLTLGITLGELTETLQMLRNPFRALTDALSKLPIRSYRKGILLGDALGGGWLTFQYGVVPLMLEIQSIIELANTIAKRSFPLLRFKGGRSDSSDTTVFVQTISQVFVCKGIRTTTTTSEAHATLFAQGSGFGDGFTPSDFGLGLGDIPGIAWELTRLSFVVDWLFGVGNWLGSLRPNPNVKYLGTNTVSVKTTVKQKVRFTSVTAPGATLVKTDAGEYSQEGSQLQRVCNLPIPGLPVFSFDTLSFARVLTSIALLWQQIPRTWRRR